MAAGRGGDECVILGKEMGKRGNLAADEHVTKRSWRVELEWGRGRGT